MMTALNIKLSELQIPLRRPLNCEKPAQAQAAAKADGELRYNARQVSACTLICSAALTHMNKQ